jgi:hypothetical protein
MTEPLAPCPWCGKKPKAHQWEGAGSFWYSCGDCGVEQREYPTLRAATAAWNRRAEPAPDEVRKILDDDALCDMEAAKQFAADFKKMKCYAPLPDSWLNRLIAECLRIRAALASSARKGV